MVYAVIDFSACESNAMNKMMNEFNQIAVWKLVKECISTPPIFLRYTDICTLLLTYENTFTFYLDFVDRLDSFCPVTLFY
jgi:hypothetical protein